jgi:hypothetical protein
MEAEDPVSGVADQVKSERTAWQYVTAMHAAAVGGPRAPIRGIVEDVEDMREGLMRERDVACARVAELERRLAELRDLGTENRDGEAALRRPVAMAPAPRETKAPAEAPNRRIGLAELVLNENMVTLEQCLEAVRLQKQDGGSISAAFVRLGFLKDEEILAALARTYSLPSIDLDHLEVPPALLEILPSETVRRHKVLPVAAVTTLTLAVADPGDRLAIDAIRGMTGCDVQLVVASESALGSAIDRHYGPTGSLGSAAQTSASRGLRLAWSRGDAPQGDPEGGPEGDRPAA